MEDHKPTVQRVKAVRLKPHSLRARQAHRRRGVTLLELVTTLAILGILIAALGSTIVLASRAIPGSRSPVSHSVTAARAMEQITAELAEATSFHEASDRTLRFTLPGRETGDDPSDRNDDDEIRYTWSGQAGDPLYRRYNSVEEVFIESVQQWEVSPTIVSQPDEDAVAPMIEDSETVIASYDATSAPISRTSFSLSSGKRIAQQFTPNLSGGAVLWRPTRAAAYLYTVSPIKDSDTMRFELRPTSGDGYPDSAALASTTVAETSITSGAWHVVSLTASQDLQNGVPYYLYLTYDSGGTAAQVRRAAPLVNGNRLAEDPGTNAWTEADSTVFFMFVWGKPLIEDPDWVRPSTNVVTRVTLTLNTGEEDSTAVRAAVAPLNQPEAP